MTACRQHEPDPATFTREKDCPDPADLDAVISAMRDPGRVGADLFAVSDYPVLAVCAACGAILRAPSFYWPFTPAVPAPVPKVRGVHGKAALNDSGEPAVLLLTGEDE